ncbi:hypothetical protein GQ600_18403 [Phytophthora cactorum]|nr:hypothetical protein GQ600_18403 [Phytophthora cactorum]
MIYAGRLSLVASREAQSSAELSFSFALLSTASRTLRPVALPFRTLPTPTTRSMPTATLYALLTPATLDTASYVYVKTPSEVQQGRYNVEHVASGRWSDLGLHDTARSRELRVVSEEEAISGIGTYVGSALCVARVSHGQLKVWDYDMVVGIPGRTQRSLPEGTIVETSRHGNSSAEVDRLEQLYDSADDLGEELEESGETPESKRTKRGREETGDPPSAKASGTDTKSKFKPSRQQMVAHCFLVNVDVDEEREYQRLHGMTDFSSKNKLPGPPKAAVIADIVTALDVFLLLVNEMYQPMVTDLVDGARRFLLQRVTSLKVEAALKPTPNRKEPCQMGAHRKVKAKYNAVSFPVPPALPIQKGKKLCMKYLSTEGCTGEGVTCIYDYWGHFIPNKLPGIDNAFISKAYGGHTSGTVGGGRRCSRFVKAP